MTTAQIMLKEATYKIPSKEIAIRRCAGTALISNIENDISINIFSAVSKKQKQVRRGNYEIARLARVYRLDMKDSAIRNIPRAGVVFYSFIGEELHICFGRDKQTGELTDFGGARTEKIGETSIRCAIREGNEESRLAFSRLNIDQVQNFFCLYSSAMLIIFIPVVYPDPNVDIRDLTKQNFNDSRFLNHHQKKDPRYNEISELAWVNEAQFKDLFSVTSEVPMYIKVKKFIKSCDLLFKNFDLVKNLLKNIIRPTEDIPTMYPFY